MPDKLFNRTGIQPVVGLLDDPAKIDQDDDIIIDELPPDYEILKQVNFKYSYTDSYLGYATRGCIRKCEFCAVKEFEPHYIPYKDVKKIVKEVFDMYGEKQNLLLMDNNVLASECFDKIIDDIKSAGFENGAVFGKTKRKRIVDFNQGLDGRLLTEHKMKRLSEIPLEPMRIAFDSIKFKKTYIKAVRLAHKYGQRNMSNYILYNYQDTPDDFYERLKINIDLNDEFRKDASLGKGVKTIIYSFPMRYIPLSAQTRKDLETGNTAWNKKYLRGLQLILNVIKGPVMPGTEFFKQAFGVNSEEFKAILLMPDDFIRNRLKTNWREIEDRKKRWMPYVAEWMTVYSELSEDDKSTLLNYLGNNNREDILLGFQKSPDGRIKKLLEFHLNAKRIIDTTKNGDAHA